jgi:hypothetical protein
MKLHDVQREFATAVLRKDGAQIVDQVKEDGLSGERRLQIYRNNTYSLLTDVLKNTFPAVCRVVGAEFFEYAAREYIRVDPPRQPCLYVYGADLADFLAAFAPASELRYLPDLARIEWALNEAYYAPDACPLPIDALKALRPEEYADVRLRPHPSCRLLASRFPVDRIWEMARPGGNSAEVPALDSGPAWLLINRIAFDVRLTKMTEATYRFAELLIAGQTVGSAYEHTIAIDPAFDLAAALKQHLAGSVFVSFEIAQ